MANNGQIGDLTHFKTEFYSEYLRLFARISLQRGPGDPEFT